MMTLADAARASRVSTKTLRRRLARGDFPGALQDPAQRGAWVVPVSDLLAAGLNLAPESVVDRPPAVPEVEALQAQVVEWRTRALVAEAVAEERGAALEAERLALRALTAGPEAPSPRARRWWHRGDESRPS